LHYDSPRQRQVGPFLLHRFGHGTGRTEKKPHPKSQIETSNGAEMKKTLHSFAALLCLLTLLLSATSCLHDLHAEQSKQATCDYCSKPAPLDHSTPSCCRARQEQPSAIMASTNVEQPALSTDMGGPLPLGLAEVFLSPPIKISIELPQPPPLIALRI
jgi:hypothetical protein